METLLLEQILDASLHMNTLRMLPSRCQGATHYNVQAQTKKYQAHNKNALDMLNAKVFEGIAWRRICLSTFWMLPSTCPHAKQTPEGQQNKT